MSRVVCVHPDPHSLERWRRALLEHRRDWDVECHTDSMAAWHSIAATPPDLVVVACGPVCNGRSLLALVRDGATDVARVLVTDHAEPSDESELAQRVLPMSLEPARFVEALAQVLQHRESLVDPVLRGLLGRIGKLPAAPEVHGRLVKRMQDPHATLVDFAAILAEDPALATQVLRVANSAYFGRDRAVTDLAAAAGRLGTRLFTDVVLAAETLEAFGTAAASFDMSEFQRHAASVARVASTLERRAPWAEDAFMAGLLHDVGRLVLATRLPDEFAGIERLVEREGWPHHVAERQVLGTDHARIGAALLGTWGLPSAVVTAVRQHHECPLLGDLVLDTTVAVALAERLVHDVEGDLALPTAADPTALDGGDPRWPWWRALAGELDEDAMAA